MNTPMENLSKGQQASRVTAEINNLYNSVDFLVRHSETPENLSVSVVSSFAI